MLHGWIILDKPVGLGSTQAVGAVKRLLREAGEPKTKVGHGGTLDPLASGVLPIALGEATKLAGRMLDATKEYEFTIRFGEETDTLDGEGVVIAAQRPSPDLAEIEAALPALHRRNRAGPAGLFGAEDRRQSRLRPGPRRRNARNEAAPGHRPRAPHLRASKDRTKSPSPPPSPRALTSAALRATLPVRSAPSAT